MPEQYLRQNFRITPNSQQVGIQICGSSTFGRYQKIGSGLTYNMFISEDWLINFAGYKKAIKLNEETTSCRGLFKSTRGNFLLAVTGSAVYRVDSGYGVSFIANIETSNGEVFMDENLNSQICIVDGLNAYIYYYGAGPSFTKQTGGPLGTSLIPNYVSFHNTFFLIGNRITDGNGARWYVYRYNSPTTIVEQTNLALSTKPDSALAVRRLPGQASNVLVFGRTVCEIWTAVGGLQNYRRNSSVNIDYGCASVSTIASSDQYTAWLGVNEDNQPVIMVYAGEGIVRISTDGIDYLLGSIQEPQNSTALFFRQDGHLFYQLTFFGEQDKLTIVYDFNTQKFFNLCDYNSNFHPARDMVHFNNKLFFASLKNGYLYETSTDITVYNENYSSVSKEWLAKDIHVIPRSRICESIRRPDSSRFIANSFVFTMAQGDDPNVTGLSLYYGGNEIMITEDGQIMLTEYGDEMVTEGNNMTGLLPNFALNPVNLVYQPRIDMAISKDSGTTWSNYVSRTLNPIGKRKNIITYNNLGEANDLTIKLRFWGLSSFVVTDGLVEIY